MRLAKISPTAFTFNAILPQGYGSRQLLFTAVSISIMASEMRARQRERGFDRRELT